ncbi:MAG: aldolase/citrate lyase family protein [Allorhizobium sp.]
MSVNHENPPLISPAPFCLSDKSIRSILIDDGLDRNWGDAGPASKADAVLFDLSSVDHARTEAARQRAVDFAKRRRGAQSTQQKFLIGIHGMDDDDRARADLLALLPLRPDAVVVTANRGAEIQKLDVMLSVEEVINGQTPGETRIIALCGHATGVLAAQSFSHKSARLKALAFDARSLGLSLGAGHIADIDGRWNDTLTVSRSLMLLGARAASIAAIDCAPSAVFSEALFAACVRSVGEGFGAMLTRDAAQLATINAVFGSPAEC